MDYMSAGEKHSVMDHMSAGERETVSNGSYECRRERKERKVSELT